jgi:GTP pyrophosphokinase
MVDVDLRNLEHLHRVTTALEAETNVSEVARHRDPKRATLTPPRS